MAANRAPLTREGLLGAWRMTSRTYEIVGPSFGPLGGKREKFRRVKIDIRPKRDITPRIEFS